jgi:type IV pilus assembly protein PilW
MALHALPSGPRRSRGLSLVELLVGVAIGLIGLVAIFQAVATWTKHSQTTSSGSDAQVAGTLALFSIERDLKQAGHGFGRAVTPVMGCNVAVTDLSPARAFNFGLRPVEIAASAGGAPDRISVLYGDSSFYGEESAFINSTTTTKTLNRRGGFKRGDIVVAAFSGGASAASATCELLEINDDSNPDLVTVGHTGVAYASFYAASGASNATPRFNSASSSPVAGGTLYDLGPQPIRNTWEIVNNRALVKTDLIGAQGGSLVAQEVAEGVVNLKAEYGYDSDNNGQIAAAEWMATLPPSPDWKRLLAVRVAVLVRSRQFEHAVDTGASGPLAPTPTAANPKYFADTPPAKTFLMTNLDGSADSFGDTDAVPNNWRFYRYRVYERVIPLRNMLWGNYPS